MLVEISDRPGYKFNPQYFVCDEGGANYKAVREVYGEDFVRHRVKGCQWHFKSDVKNHINKVGPSHRERFAEICNEMCHITTVSAFNDLLKKFSVKHAKVLNWIRTYLQGILNTGLWQEKMEARMQRRTLPA